MPETMNTAHAFLTAAGDCMGQRATEYDTLGGSERSMAATVAAFNAITGRTGDRALTETEGWGFMEVLKMVRFFSAPSFHVDSAIDAIAYAALRAEAGALAKPPSPPGLCDRELAAIYSGVTSSGQFAQVVRGLLTERGVA